MSSVSRKGATTRSEKPQTNFCFWSAPMMILAKPGVFSLMLVGAKVCVVPDHSKPELSTPYRLVSSTIVSVVVTAAGS